MITGFSLLSGVKDSGGMLSSANLKTTTIKQYHFN